MAAFISGHAALIGQCFGFAAMATGMLMYQFRRYRTIMLLMVLCSGLWCLHFAFLGKLTGVVMNVINVARAVVYARREKKWANSNLWPALFILLAALTVVFTWENAWSVLPCLASVCATLGNWQKDTQKLRLYTIGVCAGWFVYNAVSGSIAGMANEAIVFGSVIVGLIRYRKRGDAPPPAAPAA